MLGSSNIEKLSATILTYYTVGALFLETGNTGHRGGNAGPGRIEETIQPVEHVFKMMLLSVFVMFPAD